MDLGRTGKESFSDSTVPDWCGASPRFVRDGKKELVAAPFTGGEGQSLRDGVCS